MLITALSGKGEGLYLPAPRVKVAAAIDDGHGSITLQTRYGLVGSCRG